MALVHRAGIRITLAAARTAWLQAREQTIRAHYPFDAFPWQEVPRKRTVTRKYLPDFLDRRWWTRPGAAGRSSRSVQRCPGY